MTQVLLSLGANMGNPAKQIGEAVIILKSKFDNLIHSSLYETEPVLANPELIFLNMAISFDTILSPYELHAILKGIEYDFGRTRPKTEINAPRLLDIDIIYFGDTIIKTEMLTIPHPRAFQRHFVLKPIVEIARDFIDPISMETVSTLLSQCNDTHWVKKQAGTIQDVA